MRSGVRRAALLLMVTISVTLSSSAVAAAQQMPDRSFRPMIEDRAYAIGTGPVVCFDEGHDNAHTLADGFWPFADLIRRDGYVVRATKLDRESLEQCRIVIIAAPRTAVAIVDEVRTWVSEGGSLLLVVDRGGVAAASSLAAAFAVVLSDAAATPARFAAADRTLRAHSIARGRHAKESASHVMTFAGLGMRVPDSAEPLLVGAVGVVQGAVLRIDRGRAAFFTDPALFTAQIVGPDRRVIGMSAPGASQNFRFVLNVMHWLSGVI